MYPRNAASPERIDIGAVVQISDGAVQTSGCTVRIIPAGGAEGDGAGTTAYSTDGVVLYTPTQAETNYTSFILIAKKTGCIPASKTVVTSAASVAGMVDVGAISGDSAAADNLEKAYDGTGYNVGGGDIVAASVTAGVTASTVSDKTGYSLAGGHGLATEAKQDTIIGYVDCLPATWVVPPAGSDWTAVRAAYLDAAISSRLATSGYTAPDNATIGSISGAVSQHRINTEVTLDKLGTMIQLDEASSPQFTANALEQVPKTGYKLASDGLDSVVIETGLNARQALSVIAASAAGVLDGAATEEITIAAAGMPATNRITATVDENGNRSAVTLSPPT